jgi:molybdopterin/thiamine biosynthesis adenylyltransferase/rhodanese-related sulfurtransferase
MNELPELNQEEVSRYLRHLVLPEIGVEGQRRLKASRLLVVGAGGLGSPVLLYLAAAGVGTIGVVDSDVVSLSNLQRQIVHGEADIGRPKARSARDRLLDLNAEVVIKPHAEAFTSATAERIATGYDIVIDGTDNFPTRYLINDVCLKLGIPFIYGAIFRMEGQASVFCTPDGPCYRCVFPDPPPPDSVMTCEEAGVLGVVPGTIGTLQATEAMKLILKLGSPLAGRLLVYSADEMRFETISVKKNLECPVCSIDPSQIELIDYAGFCGTPIGSPEDFLPSEALIGPSELKRLLDAGEPVRIVDVRQPIEWEIVHLEESSLIPRDRLSEELYAVDRGERIVVVCRSGVRSARVVVELRAAGFRNVRSLAGGIIAWVEEIEPHLPTY